MVKNRKEKRGLVDPTKYGKFLELLRNYSLLVNEICYKKSVSYSQTKKSPDLFTYLQIPDSSSKISHKKVLEFSGAFAEFQRRLFASSYLSVLPSTRPPMKQIGSHWMFFHEI